MVTVHVLWWILIGFCFLVGEALLGDFNACFLACQLGGWVGAATSACVSPTMASGVDSWKSWLIVFFFLPKIFPFLEVPEFNTFCCCRGWSKIYGEGRKIRLNYNSVFKCVNIYWCIRFDQKNYRCVKDAICNSPCWNF
jgi:hypothetical protein